MPNWLIVVLVCVGIGALIGIISSLSEDSDMNTPQGCLAGGIMGGMGGLGCIGYILMAIIPFLLMFWLVMWLFD